MHGCSFLVPRLCAFTVTEDHLLGLTVKVQDVHGPDGAAILVRGAVEDVVGGELQREGAQRLRVAEGQLARGASVDAARNLTCLP